MVKITLISDTHGRHAKLQLKGGDMIIHAGDVSGRGFTDEIKDFLGWYASLPYRYKIFIAGNHDFFFERKSQEEIDAVIPKDIIYLNDTGCIVEGISIWGSPVQPWFHDWAFNRDRGEQIKKHWNLIPEKTDILITHGPPYGIFDKTVHGDHVGCEDLLDAVKRIRPRIHVFGHIHEAYGSKKINDTHFYNASVLDEQYLLVNDPTDINFTLK